MLVLVHTTLWMQVSVRMGENEWRIDGFFDSKEQLLTHNNTEPSSPIVACIHTHISHTCAVVPSFWIHLSLSHVGGDSSPHHPNTSPPGGPASPLEEALRLFARSILGAIVRSFVRAHKRHSAETTDRESPEGGQKLSIFCHSHNCTMNVGECRQGQELPRAKL